MQSIKDVLNSMSNITQEEKVEMNRLVSKVKKVFKIRELLTNMYHVDQLTEMIAEYNDD